VSALRNAVSWLYLRVVLATSAAILRAHAAHERGQRARCEAWLATAGALLWLGRALNLREVPSCDP
jgi:hypothetical protein